MWKLSTCKRLTIGKLFYTNLCEIPIEANDFVSVEIHKHTIIGKVVSSSNFPECPIFNVLYIMSLPYCYNKQYGKFDSKTPTMHILNLSNHTYHTVKLILPFESAMCMTDHEIMNFICNIPNIEV
jgi:hypothetical protein